MSKTHTAPWDYNRNTPMVYGAELDEMNAVKDRLADAKSQLVQIIGQRSYSHFEYSLPIATQTNTRLLLAEIEYELDRYECSCRPDGNACPGCVKLNEAKENCNV